MRPGLVRPAGAGGIGVATGLLGAWVPIVGLVAAIAVEAIKPAWYGRRLALESGSLERVTEGIADGSAALLGQAISRNVLTRNTAAHARPLMARP